MSIRELEFAVSNLYQILALRLDTLRKAGGVDASKILRLASDYRRLGCGLLLSTYDAEGFCEHLFLAADAYLQLLERKEMSPGLDPYYLARSRAQPLLDALAIGDMALAGRIGERMEPRWMEGMEYEEDFCFFELLPLLASSMGSQELALKCLERMEQALEGAAYPRYEAVAALVRGAPERFEAALLALGEEWQSQVRRQRQSGLGDHVFLLTEANVFIEGLALVRLASARGIPTRSQYPLIPPVVLTQRPRAHARVALWR
ncbi:Imm49 family immunity protein [Archangium sp.]|uniref:Imm49 family immunity protein n=1 Tax=Archangium sp. TaxID=1872627 RepID=UPI002D5B375F|nr:Imm49 family immunity protein [Archangium sp.]HYO53976.1 Imm49 family immunity protein [Archangium sp.]